MCLYDVIKPGRGSVRILYSYTARCLFKPELVCIKGVLSVVEKALTALGINIGAVPAVSGSFKKVSEL